MLGSLSRKQRTIRNKYSTVYSTFIRYVTVVTRLHMILVYYSLFRCSGIILLLHVRARRRLCHSGLREPVVVQCVLGLVAHPRTIFLREWLVRYRVIIQMTYVEDIWHRHASRRQEAEDAAGPGVAQSGIHWRANDREDCRHYGASNNGGGNCTRTIDAVRIHEVLNQALHDDSASESEWDASKDWDYPVSRGITCPESLCQSGQTLKGMRQLRTRQTKTG